MPSQKPSKKRTSGDPKQPPKKRARTVARRISSASQPITVDNQPATSLLSTPSTPSPKALPDALEASQATSTFESQLRDDCLVDEIVAPEGSEQATVAPSVASSHTTDKPFNREYEDNYDGIDWSRLPRFMKPATTSRRTPSWIYQHGYRVVLRSDMETVYFVCNFCHIHKYIDAGLSGVYLSAATTGAARHLEEIRPGHGHVRPGKARESYQPSPLRRMFSAGITVSQAVANKLSNFSI